MAQQQIARNGKKTGTAMAIFALVLCPTATSLWAQGVPLPNPRPALSAQTRAPAVTGSILARNDTPPAPRPPTGGPVQQPSPIINPFAALLGKTGSAANLTPEQRAIVDKINNYLSSMQTLEGQFVQVGPDGGRSQGEFYISKPGRVRFEYDAPSTIELVADGQSVVVRDTKLATQDVYPLAQTPLRFLLSDHVDLMKDAGLAAVYADDVFVTAVVEEKNGLVGTSRLMIMFSAKDMQLKQWTVTDPQGFDTTVAVYNLDASKKPDPAMFRIDFNRYKN
jgi:outer membrane lipoprotein-sorting protein